MVFAFRICSSFFPLFYFGSAYLNHSQFFLSAPFQDFVARDLFFASCRCGLRLDLCCSTVFRLSLLVARPGVPLSPEQHADRILVSVSRFCRLASGAGSFGVQLPSVGTSVSRPAPLPISLFPASAAPQSFCAVHFSSTLGTREHRFRCKLSVLIFVLLLRFRILSGGLLLTAPARGLVLRFRIFASSIVICQAN
jgi:hypothetical protein